jgi:hypothetical protein
MSHVPWCNVISGRIHGVTSSKRWRHVVGLERMTSHILWCDITSGRIHYVTCLLWMARCGRVVEYVTSHAREVMSCNLVVEYTTSHVFCDVTSYTSFLYLRTTTATYKSIFGTVTNVYWLWEQWDRQYWRGNITCSSGMFTVGTPYLYYHKRTHRICRYLSHLWTTFHMQPRHSSPIVTFSTN